jgi:hypothetical protein
LPSPPAPNDARTAISGAAAASELKHGEWIAMINSDLPFTRSTANKLMKIATCDHIRNAEHVPHLPVHWGTLHDLTLLTEEQFERGIESGAINPKMQRKDVKALRGEQPKAKVAKVEKIPEAPKPRNFKDVSVDLAIEIERTVKGLSKEDRADFLMRLESVIASLKNEEQDHGE